MSRRGDIRDIETAETVVECHVGPVTFLRRLGQRSAAPGADAYLNNGAGTVA